MLYVFGDVLNSAARLAGLDQRRAQDNSNTQHSGMSQPGQAHKQGPTLAAAKPSRPASRRNPVGILEPPFLRKAFLFGPDSTELSEEGQNTINGVSSWLGEHPEVRVLIVGFCDPSGSEACTHALAERRGSVLEELLVKHGNVSAQIVGAKGWEKADPVCAAATPACQAMNRRARIFIAGLGSVH